MEGLGVPIIGATVTLKIAEALIDLRCKYPKRSATGKGSSAHDKTSGTRIKLLVPTDRLGPAAIESAKQVLNTGSRVHVVQLKGSPKSIKSAYEVAHVSPFIIREAASAANEGYHAVVISSPQDPALESAREVCHIPVIGAGESSMLMACLLGRKFSIVTGDDSVDRLLEIVARIGLEQRLVDNSSEA